MGKYYRHLTSQDRIQLYEYLFTGEPITENAFSAPIYFCEPYKSYQKGAIENGNRLLRRYLPKKSSIEKHSQQDIEMIVDKLNNQPMRCLDYRTPMEAFYEYRGARISSPEIRT